MPVPPLLMPVRIALTTEFSTVPVSHTPDTQAYQIFCQLSQQRSLNLIKRSVFREIMRDLVRDRFNLALRHDVPDASNRHQQAWKGLALVGGGLGA